MRPCSSKSVAPGLIRTICTMGVLASRQRRGGELGEVCHARLVIRVSKDGRTDDKQVAPGRRTIADRLFVHAAVALDEQSLGSDLAKLAHLVERDAFEGL